MTSGGTDSITMAVAARDAAPIVDGGLAIVLPYSAHLAFDKAAPNGYRDSASSCKLRSRCGAMQRALDNDTLMLVGSAPSFPFGLIDPIDDLSRIAQK